MAAPVGDRQCVTSGERRACALGPAERALHRPEEVGLEPVRGQVVEQLVGGPRQATARAI